MSDANANFGGVYTVECRDADGNLKWEDSFPNRVVNVGLQDINSKYFTGVTYTASWYLGLVSGPGGSNTYAATDTLASHAGWTEATGYSSATRPSITFGSATAANPSVISSSSAASFTMNASATIAGAFLTNANTGTSGLLFSVGNFSAGDRSVVSGDTLLVTYTFFATAT